MVGGLLVNLDSVAQRKAHDASPDRALHELTGVLRVGCLLTGSVLMTDAQVLDGPLLLQAGPYGVMDRIGDSFEVFARAETLEESLRCFFDNGGETLRYIELSGLHGASRAERIRLANSISLHPADTFRDSCSQHGVTETLSLVLVQHGAARDAVAELRSGWDAWIEAADEGDVTVTQRPYHGLDLLARAKKRPLRRLLSGPGSAMVASEIMDLIRRSATRSEIRSRILESSLSDDDQVTAEEWFDAVYVCSIAKHYGTIAVELPRSTVERLSRRRSADEVGLMLNVESARRLCEVKTATFEVIYDRTRDDAAKWLASRRDRHIRHLASTVDQSTATDSAMRRERFKTAGRLAAVAGSIQIGTQLELGTALEFMLPLAAILLADLVPLAYRSLMPKGRLTAVVDPIAD